MMIKPYAPKKAWLASALVFTFLLTTITSVNAREVKDTPPETHTLSLFDAVTMALKNDPWLSGNQYQQRAVEAMSIVAGELPDPQFSIGIANLATDTFDFGQEPMTQLKVGVSQMFPRGDTRTLKQQQLTHLGGQFPYQRQARQLRVAETVAKLWFDAYKAKQSIALIERDRALFEQLVDVALASYSSAMGKTRQQDIIRAQLELTRLDDRLLVLLQDYEANQQRLSRWLSDNSSGQYTSAHMPSANLLSPIAGQMPDIGLIHPSLYTQDNAISLTVLAEHFHGHPDIQAIQQKIRASMTGIEVEKQKYQPEWGVNTSYAYRDDDALGKSRADFFSIGLTLDIPLFTENRQDKEVESAVATTEAIKTEKILLLRQLMATFATAKTQLDRLDQRQHLYRSQLLPQMVEQAEASLTAYTNDDGDFAEVVRARIAQLNAKIDVLAIDVERQKTIIGLNALFATNSQQIVSSTHKGKIK